MRIPARPPVLGIDDGPFAKRQAQPVPIVGVTMEGADLVESVAVTEFPVDGSDATAFLARFVHGLRARDGLHGVVLGGITIAGLGIVEIEALADSLGRPVLAVNRRSTGRSELARAPPAAGLGGGPRLRATLRKARLPEPLRVAHLLARALVMGQSRGRV